MKTANEFRKDKINELEKERTELQKRIKLFEECAKKYANELIEFYNNPSDYGEEKAVRLIKITHLNPEVVDTIVTNHAYQYYWSAEWTFEKEIQSIHSYISICCKKLKEWKSMTPKEVGASGEFNAMNNSISN